MHLIRSIRRQFEKVSWSNFNCILSKMFLEFSKLCLSQNWAASDQDFSKIPPNSVLAETQVHPIENNLRRFQFVTSPNFNSIWLKFFQVISKMSLRRISIATYRKYCYTIPNCILAEKKMHVIEIILRKSHNVSRSKLNSVW